MKQSMKKAALVLMLALAVLLVPQWSNTALAVTTPSDITTGSDLPPAPPLPTPPAEGEVVISGAKTVRGGEKLTFSVTIDGKVHGQIGEGFLILLGITHEDTEAQAVKLADKLTGLRIFEDENGKMNRGLDEVKGELLVVSQFTLYGNCKKGRRPEFLAAARPEVAIPLYEKFVELCRAKGFHTETGEFGAYMQVESLNDGPVTLVVDTDQL